MNKTLLIGRIPFDMELKNGDDDKKAFMGFTVSVQRDFKPEGEKYYPEDLIYCKAFAKTAQFINKHWSKGDHIIIEGRVERDDDFEKDGATVKGQMYVKVQDVKFVPKNSGNGGGSDTKEEKKTETKAPASSNNPLAGKNSATKKRPF